MEKQDLYLVTGATGFVGNNLVKLLLAQNKRIRCIVRSIAKARSIFGEEAPIEYIEGSVTDPVTVKKAFGDHSDLIVLHVAGVVSISGKKHQRAMYETNIGGTVCLVDQACASGVKKFVYVSSVHAIAPPPKGVIVEDQTFDPNKVKGVYAKTKSIGSAYVLKAAKERDLDAVLLHPSGIIGPNDYGETYLTKLIIDYKRNRLPAGVKGGYNFVDVRDVAESVLAAAQYGVKGESYLVTGEYVTVKQLFEILYRQLHGKNIRLILPIWVAYVGLPFLKLYSMFRRAEPLYGAYALYTLQSNGNFTSAKAEATWGYHPRTVEQSISDSIEFLKEEGRL